MTATGDTKVRRGLRTAFDRSVLLAVFLCGCAGVWFVHQKNEQVWHLRQQERLGAIGQAVLDSFDLNVVRTVEAVRGAALMVGSNKTLSHDEFSTFADRTLGGLETLQRMDWQPRVQERARKDFERAVQQAGYPAFRIRQQGENGVTPAASRSEYFPVLYSWPNDGGFSGLDGASDPALARSQQKSRDTTEPVATGLLDGAPNARLPEVPHIVITAPAYRAGAPLVDAESRRSNLLGYIVGTVAVPLLLREAEFRADSAQLDLLVFDLGDRQRRLLHSHVGKHSDLDPLPAYEAKASDLVLSVAVASRPWEIILHPRPGFFAGRERLFDRLLVAGGLLVTLILAVALAWAQRSARSSRVAQEQAVLSEQRMNLALEGADLALFDWNIVTGAFSCNTRFSNLVGYDGDGITLNDPKTRYALIHPKDRERMKQAQVQHLTGKSESVDVEYRVRHKDERWVWVLERGKVVERDAAGNPRRMAGTFLDITEHKRNEETLKAREARLSNLFASIQDLILVIDTAGIINECNVPPGFALPIDPDAVLHKEFGSVLPPELVECLSQAIAEILDDGKRQQRELVLTINGQVACFKATTSQLADSGKFASGFLTLVHDITESKRSEQQMREFNETLEQRIAERTRDLEDAMETLNNSQQVLARSEAKATLATLIASVSHELNTPLGNGVITASALADHARNFQAIVDSGQIRRSDINQFLDVLRSGTELLVRNLERARGLMNNFRQVSADQASEQRRSFDLATAIQEVLATLSPSLKRHSHKVIVDIPPNIMMDSLPGPLGQVAINLINNAYLHAFEGRQGGELRISAVAQRDSVTMRFADNGVGMSSDTVERMFQPFFSTKIGRGGTGLGMSIVERLVSKVLGGSLSVTSQSGIGTCFEIQLPLCAPLSE